ncbi:MAG: DUF4139 domain-containing protein [Hellea sp.]|nr:DUF4139 domain-containing protein [Hellea sp.]
MKRALFTASIIVLLGCSAPSQASDPLETQTDASDELALTIYGDGRALIEDNRRIRFSGGEEVVALPGVSSAILPQSVTVKADGMTIIEQNFDFDLLTPQKLMEKAVGQYVEIVKTNPATGEEYRETAKVLSVNNGVVIQVGDQIEVLRDDNIPTRVIFPKVPDNLRASPTLSLRVDARSGSRDANMTYISSGISWRADYVAVFNEDDKRMNLQGWATIDNTTNTTFHDAELSVVAGQVGNAQPRNQYNNYNRNVNQGQRSGGMEAGSAERIGDNYLYPLPGTTSLASKQKKQISFVDASNVKAEKVYEYYNWNFQTIEQPANVDSRIAFSNSKAGGMGEALPAGTVRVYAEDKKGKAQFIGEDLIGHITAGSDISMKIGEAFDITVQPTLVKSTDISRRVRDYEMKYEVRNASGKEVSVNIYQSVYGRYYDFQMLKESDDHVRKNDDTLKWTIDVPAEGEAVLTFKIRQTSKW